MKIDCKEIAAKAKEQIERACKNKNLKFGIIQVGDNQASNIYIKGKMKDCAEVGIETTIFKYQENITQSSLSEKLNFLVKSNTLDAIIIQLPLPAQLDINLLMKIVPNNMDVDNLKGTSPYIPATPKGILMMMDYLEEDFERKHVVMIGRSKIVGEPMAALALMRNATVTHCHSKTPKDLLISSCKSADIIISAVGRPNFITKEFINTAKRQILIDVGINRDEDGKLCGDADSEIYNIDTLDYTSVPGGVGLMTRVGLLKNISMIR